MFSIKKNADTTHTYAFETNQDIDLSENISQVTTNTDFKTFYQLATTIYHDDPYWVQPFWNEYKAFFNKNNPFWTHAEAALFIAYKENKPIGRIAAFKDQLYKTDQNEPIGFFGFFECIQKYHYAKSLLKTAEQWLSAKNCTLMQGPINGRIDNGCGFLYQGFNASPMLLSTYNPSYYHTFAERYHMEKLRDQYSYHIDLTKPLPKKLQEKAKQCEQSGITIRSFNRMQTNKELNWWIDFFLETFQDHWGYIPTSKNEVACRFGIKQMRWIVDPALFLIAEADGEPVAYIWGTPDYNQLFKQMNGTLGISQLIRFVLKKHQITQGKLQLIGIKKETRHQSVGSCLNYKTLHEMKKRGYQCAEVGWIDEFNTVAHQTIALTGATVSKKSRVYTKTIDT